MAHDVFISHESKDRAVAEAACEAIERAGHLCWIAPRDADSGGNGDVAPVGAIGACKVFLLILSGDSAESSRVEREAERADKAGLAIILFRIEDVEPSPGLTYSIGAARRLDALKPPLGPHLDHMTAIVGRLLEGGEGAPLRPLTQPPMPMPRATGGTPLWLPIVLAGLVGLIALAIVVATRGITLMDDRAAIGAAVDEMYAMISGPKGPRDWSRQADCFHPEARQIRTWIDEAGRPAMTIMGLDDYARDTTSFFAANDFYEVEIDRRIDLFGNIAQVWSAYEARSAPGVGVPERRGINSIQLFRDPEAGWRIIAMIWDNERAGLALPAFD